MALSLALLTLLNVPYLVAMNRADGLVFGGSLIAVPDGHSYLAKMQAGAAGDWLYTLRFTNDPGPGVLLFTYYLGLGHLARLSGLAVLVVYHLARLAGGLFFLLTLYHVGLPLAPTTAGRLKRWAAVALAGGLGWLVTPLSGALSPDLWVAESIPLLSLFANPHFPLAWALVLWLLYWGLPEWSGPITARSWRVAGVTLVLAEIYPMALPTVLLTLGGASLLNWRARGAFSKRELLIPVTVGLVAAPRLLYTAWLTRTHAQLASWNLQNASPAPDLPLALAWGGVPLALALIGLIWVGRSGEARGKMWAVWLFAGVGAIYFPYELQRRLSLGLMFPLVQLGIAAWQAMIAPRLGSVARRGLTVVLALAAALSNALVWAGALAAAGSSEPEIFLQAAEARAIAALPADAVVVAAPELGGLIPTRSEARVIYGHAAETPNAEARRADVLDFFAGDAPADFLELNGVTHVFYGAREAALGQLQLPETGWRLLSDDGGLRVYVREAQP